MLFVGKQRKLTRNVVTGDEARAFGLHLDRRFEEPDIKNYVGQPPDWNERGKGVKTTGSMPQRCANVWIVRSVGTKRRSVRCVKQRAAFL